MTFISSYVKTHQQVQNLLVTSQYFTEPITEVKRMHMKCCEVPVHQIVASCILSLETI